MVMFDEIVYRRRACNQRKPVEDHTGTIGQRKELVFECDDDIFSPYADTYS